MRSSCHPSIPQPDLLISKQACKFICNTHKLQPGVGITVSESLCLLFCFHSGLSLQAEGFLTPRYPQFLLLPDSHLYMLASVLNSLVSCSWAILSYFNSLSTLSRPWLVHLLVIQIEDFYKTFGVAVQLQGCSHPSHFSFQTCSSSPACYCWSIIYQHLQYLVFLIVMTKHFMRSQVTNHKLTEIHGTGDSVHSSG